MDLVNAFDCDGLTCQHIKEMYQRAIASTGRGSWPPGNDCHPTLYPHVGYHATLAYVDHDDLMSNSSLDREVTDQEWQEVVVDAKVWPSVERPVQSVEEAKRTFIYTESEIGAKRAKRVNKQTGSTLNVLDMGHWLAFEASRRIGCFLIEVFDHPPSGIHLRTYKMPGSLAGLGYFPNGSCGDHVTCNVDSLIDYLLGWFAGLTTHELGHTLDLRHEFSNPQSKHRSILSYAQDNSPFQGYRRAGSPYNYVEDHFWPRARVLFGGDGSKSLDDIIIPVTKKLILDPLLVEYDASGRPVVRNEFEVEGRRFIVVPRPSL